MDVRNFTLLDMDLFYLQKSAFEDCRHFRLNELFYFNLHTCLLTCYSFAYFLLPHWLLLRQTAFQSPKSDMYLAINLLTLLHSEQPKLYGVLAILSAKGLNVVATFSQASHKSTTIDKKL